MRPNNVSKNYLHFKYRSVHRVSLAGKPSAPPAICNYNCGASALVGFSRHLWTPPCCEPSWKSWGVKHPELADLGGGESFFWSLSLCQSVLLIPEFIQEKCCTQYGGITDSAPALHNKHIAALLQYADLLGSISPVRTSSTVECPSAFKSGAASKVDVMPAQINIIEIVVMSVSQNHQSTKQKTLVGANNVIMADNTITTNNVVKVLTRL